MPRPTSALRKAADHPFRTGANTDAWVREHLQGRSGGWLVRLVLYYVAFELLTPFALLFNGGWPRMAEGIVFAVIAATLHPRLGRRSRALAISAIATYFLFLAVYIGVFYRGHGATGGVAVSAGVGVLLALIALRSWRHSRRTPTE
jgi:hypothetical protein